MSNLRYHDEIEGVRRLMVEFGLWWECAREAITGYCICASIRTLTLSRSCSVRGRKGTRLCRMNCNWLN